MSNEMEHSDSIARDTSALRSSMENALGRSDDDQAAETFREELRRISSGGPEHTQRVFNNIAEQLGNNNYLMNNAIVRADSLCFFPPNQTEASNEPERWQNVCAWTDGSSLTRSGGQTRVRLRSER